jgi:hypothetical protein
LFPADDWKRAFSVMRSYSVYSRHLPLSLSEQRQVIDAETRASSIIILHVHGEAALKASASASL